MCLYYYCPPDCEKAARLPRKSDAEGQRKVERMLRAVTFHVGGGRDEVVQAWF